MPLKLYRRHRKECEANHPEDFRSGQFDEGRRGWKRCACIIHASGTINGRFSRRYTATSNWEDAKAIAATWEHAASWNAPAVVPAGTSEERTCERVAIADATQAFLDKIKSRELAAATDGKYATLIKQLLAYTNSRGYLYVDQLTISDMDRFYASWPDAKRAKARKLNKLHGFAKFCIKREWITKDVTANLEPPQGHSIPANKSPFSDDEINRIVAACDKIGGPIAPGPGHREWTGEDLKDFIFVMLYTGISMR